MPYPWNSLSSWSPFKIDALGLVTLLGADEVNSSVGRLAPSYWLEYMPLLASFIFANDRFRSKQAAFTLYNVSSGIVTGNLASWFTRWMQVQDFETSRSLVYWEIAEVPQNKSGGFIVAGIISFVFTGFLIVMTILANDWYGFANAVALAVLTGVRSYLLQANRNAIDRAVEAAKPLRTTFAGAMNEWREKMKTDGDAIQPQQDSKWRPEVVKILVAMPDSRIVTMFIPEHLLRPIFVTDVSPSSRWRYRLVQWVGWVAFSVHIVTLGMAQLAAQLYVVVIMVTSTVLICYGVGCDDSRIYKWWCEKSEGSSPPYPVWAGKRLKATVFEWPHHFEFIRSKDGSWSRRLSTDIIKRKQRSTARQDLYAWLDLSPEEMGSLSDWHLLPHRRDHDDSWWMDFDAKRLLVQENPLKITDLSERINERFENGVKKAADASHYRPPEDIERGRDEDSTST
ncbi:Aldo/keto reductase [Penicillium expansum]|nr:Aldo/keto reductase [Penicillium expansum]